MADGQKLGQAKRGSLEFAKGVIAKGYRIGLIKFATSAQHLCEPQRTIEILDQSLEPIQADGSSNMADAIRLATQKLSDKGPVRIICIVTDGDSNDKQSTLDAARQAKRNGIEIITVGTDDADKDFLRKLAARTDFVTKVQKDQVEKAVASSEKFFPLASEKKDAKNHVN